MLTMLLVSGRPRRAHLTPVRRGFGVGGCLSSSRHGNPVTPSHPHHHHPPTTAPPPATSPITFIHEYISSGG